MEDETFINGSEERTPIGLDNNNPNNQDLDIDTTKTSHISQLNIGDIINSDRRSILRRMHVNHIL